VIKLPFTIAEARTLAETWVDEVLSNAQIIEWGNEFFLRKVKDTLWMEGTEEYSNSTANTGYALPAGFWRSNGVKDSNGEIYSRYFIKNRKISFAIDGSYTLAYTAYPSKIEDIEDEVLLPDVFLYPLAEYLLFRFFNIELDDEESKNAAQEYEARYNASLKAIYDEMEIDNENESFQVEIRW